MDRVALDTATLELAGDREPGQEVAGGPTSRNEDARVCAGWFGRHESRAMAIRTPTPASDIRSDDPP